MNEPSARAIFDQAMDMSPEARGAFIDGQCGANQALRMKVLGLLAAYDQADDFLAGSTAATLVASVGEGPGARIGPYKILQLIGEGGFGSVFMAEQTRPVARRVALKIIKLGMDTRAVIARFEAERQALAMMNHPNIARVLDASATESGRPYFVMELVAGDPITRYCDTNNLTIPRRLDLFVQVCHAVQHAHQKGLIHRDIKPSNILVSTQDDQPFAKVIDFGVAKATASRLTEKTLFTEHRQLIGTPEYMSPEQAQGSLDIDTRTDVYSLGVLLYELLTGTTPFDAGQLRNAAYGEIQRIIREVEPPRPSTRLSRSSATLSDIAAHRRTEPRKLGTLVRGDLDTIVLKALQKDRVRRYQSAADLGADIRRYLGNQPITARPPSVAYVLHRFARRNKALVGATAAVLAVLLAGLTVASIMAWRLHREAERRAEINSFLESMLTAVDPYPFVAVQQTRFGANVRLVDVMDDAIDRLDQHPMHDEEAEAAIRYRMGIAYFWMARFDQAYANLQKAYKVRLQRLGRDDPRTIESKIGLVWCKTYLFDSDNAAALGVEALEDCRRTLGTADERTLSAMHALLVSRLYQGYRDDMMSVSQEMYNLIKANPQVKFSLECPMDFLARGLVGAGRLDESEALLKEVIANERAENADSLTQGYAHFLLGWVADYRQDAQPAEQEMRRGLDIWASRSGLPQPELTLVLADLLCTQDARRQEGVAMVHDTMRDLTARFGTNHPFVANVKHVAAVALWHAGLLDEAEVLLREAGDAFARGGQAPIQNHVLTMQFHGQVLRELGRLEQSEAVLRQGLALADKFTPEQWHHHYWGSPARLWVELAAVCELQGRHDEAAAWARHVQDEMNQHNDCALAEQAAVTFLEVDRRDDALLMAQSLLEARRRDPRTTPEQLALAFRIVAVMQETLGRLDESEASRREQVRTLVAARGEANAGALDAMNDLAWLLDTRGKPAEAEPFARAAAEGYRRLDHPRADDQIDALDTWTVILCDLNRPDDAAATFAEMQDRWAAAYPQRPLAATYQLHYGKRLLQMHHFAEAQTILLPYVERMIHDPSSAEGDRRQAAELAADLYRKWNEVEPAKGYDVKAAEWSSRLARPDVPASRSAATRP